MSFLTTLYLAGLTLITLPVLLHLIRRTPRGRVLFSTLMFLRPSPPRVTRRSRIEHWLLLLLRATAVALLALAFSRPFFRQADEQIVAGANAHRMLLVDVSASMRRTAVWKQVNERLTAITRELESTDLVSLYTFDSELHPVLTSAEWKGLAANVRSTILTDRIQQMKPGWGGTNLTQALSQAVSMSFENHQAETAQAVELIVVSDFQHGSRLDGLQGFQWPEGVSVRAEFVKCPTEDNAAIHVSVGERSTELRVRIDNAPDASVERFRVRAESIDSHWGDHDSADEKRDPTVAASRANVEPSSPEQEVIVPPGQNRVIRIDASQPKMTPASKNQLASTTRVELVGDAESFDNTAWFVKAPPPRIHIAYFGQEAGDDPQYLRYYLERAFASSAEREVDFSIHSPGEPFITPNLPVLAFVNSSLDAGTVESLRKLIDDGLRVVCIGTDLDHCRQAFALAGRDVPEFREATVSGYAMLTSVDFEHPLFSEFNDAKLADFTKLPIWKHREVITARSPEFRVLARFDGQGPAFIELPTGRGGVILSLFGWHGDDSRLVLWSKFVPMLNHLLTSLCGVDRTPPRLTVGEALPLQQLLHSSTTKCTLKLPSGSRVSLPAESGLAYVASEPGMYVADSGGAEPAVLAVNLDPLESRTTPLQFDELRAAGLPLSQPTTSDAELDERQLQGLELESRQRLWQWLVAAGLGILLLETWLAGRMAAAPSVPARDPSS